jgi:hypothetical protein
MSYASIEEIKQANADNDGYWFSPGAMRYFGSRISKEVIGGCLFVTSEDFPASGRLYSIRHADPNGKISTVGEFGQYATLDQAKRAARKMIDCCEDCFIDEYMVKPPDGSEGSTEPNKATLTTSSAA